MRKDTFDLGQSTKVKPGDDMVISDLWETVFNKKGPKWRNETHGTGGSHIGTGGSHIDPLGSDRFL